MLSKEARAKKAEYMREWRKRNRDKANAANEQYWERKAEQDHQTGGEQK